MVASTRTRFAPPSSVPSGGHRVQVPADTGGRRPQLNSTRNSTAVHVEQCDAPGPVIEPLSNQPANRAPGKADRTMRAVAQPDRQPQKPARSAARSRVRLRRRHPCCRADLYGVPVIDRVWKRARCDVSRLRGHALSWAPWSQISGPQVNCAEMVEHGGQDPAELFGVVVGQRE